MISFPRLRLDKRARRRKPRYEMNSASVVIPAVLALILAKWGMELWLAWLNQRHVLANAGAVPAACKETVDANTYARSVDYTLAKIRLGRIETSYNTALLVLLLLSGLLPWGFNSFTHWL